MYYVSVLFMVPARYATVPTCEVSAHTLLFAPLQWETQPLCLCMQTAAVLKPSHSLTQSDKPMFPFVISSLARIIKRGLC